MSVFPLAVAPRAPWVLPLPDGGWFQDNPTGSSTQAMPANSLLASPFMPTETCRVDQVMFRVSGGSAGNARIGFYDTLGRAGGWLPGALLLEVNVDLDTTSGNTNVVLTLPAPIALVRGRLVWRAICFSATPTVNVWPVATAGGGGFFRPIGAPGALSAVGATSGQTGSRIVRDTTLTYVAASPFFPASFGAASAPNGLSVPLFAMRKAA